MAGPSAAGACYALFKFITVTNYSWCLKAHSYTRICTIDDAPRAGAGLPIRQYSQQIVDTVLHNAVTVVIGETGSGKTTQIAQVRRYPCVRRQLCTLTVLLPHALSIQASHAVRAV